MPPPRLRATPRPDPEASCSTERWPTSPPVAATTVDFENHDRAPLLLIAGGSDHVVPASTDKATAKKYEGSGAVTEYREFPGRTHFTLGQPGWEEVADFALDWASEHARRTATA